jgi:NitT/TauT family transport system substrate-binding protein
MSGKTEVNSHLGSPPYSFMELENPQVRRVMNSVEVLGNISLDLVYAPKRFIDANPKLTAAFLAALEEADKLIADDPARAAALYVQSSKAKLAADEVLRMIKDPDTKFSTTPNGTMQFANFMARVGSIKTKPASWQDLFIPAVHALPGS